MDTIIHCASDPATAQAADVGGTRHLVQALHEGGKTPHLIYVSIVGVEHATTGYYRAKYEAETIVAHSQLPWSVLRATQFHSFALRLIQALGVDLLNVITIPPNACLQPIDSSDVAERLVDLGEDGPSGRSPDLGGPQVLTLEEIIQTYLHRRGRATTVHTAELPGAMFAVFSSDAHLCPSSSGGKKTWDAFLNHWYSERDGYPAARIAAPLLLEQMVEVHHPAQVSVQVVTLGPGSQGGPPHLHPGPVFGYVLEGEVLFQMHGHATSIYKQGEVFYEPQDCLHLLATNPHPEKRAVFVAVIIGEPGQPVVIPVELRAGTNDAIGPLP
jgi:quercetin dioxygenase-like cupin family protein